MDNLPITIQMLLTVGGMCVVAGFVTQWLKAAIPETAQRRDLLVNALCLLICVVLAVLAQFIASAWQPTAEAIYNVVLLAFLAVSVTTFGYELQKNVRLPN